jgi:hypothetical protein
MQTTSLPVIDESDLKAAREFLLSLRDEDRPGPARRSPIARRGAVPVQNGIARARTRSGPRSDA